MWYDPIIERWIELWKQVKEKDAVYYEELKVFCHINDGDMQNPIRLKLIRIIYHIEILTEYLEN